MTRLQRRGGAEREVVQAAQDAELLVRPEPAPDVTSLPPPPPPPHRMR